MKTKQELALEILGHNNFDCALPQPWLDAVVEETGGDYCTVLGGTVWNYGCDNMFGEPFAITYDSAIILAQIEDKPCTY